MSFPQVKSRPTTLGGWVVTAAVIVHLLTSGDLVPGAAAGGTRWWGRTCCELSLVPQCKRSCMKAKSRDDISRSCNPSSELSLLMCLDRQAASETCCRPVADDECRAACQRVFVADSHRPSPATLRHVTERCTDSVTSCVANYTASIAWNQITGASECCDNGSTESCRSMCRQAMRSAESEDEALNQVIEHCGDVNAWVSLWQCFLHSASNRQRHQYLHGGMIDVTGIDGAKMACCRRAITSRCQQLCEQTFGTRWAESVNDFNKLCSHTSQETDLNVCLEEVDDPCQLGCTGLTHCTNFNHRPTESFRSCNKAADDTARRTIRSWELHSLISMPLVLDFDIPIIGGNSGDTYINGHIRSCEPAKWKAIACMVNIKPCRTMSATPWICRSDCMQILTRCLDVSRAALGVTPSAICDRLSTPDDISPRCLSLSSYLADSPYQYRRSEVTTPCSPNPCLEGEVCLLNRERCNTTTTLTPAASYRNATTKSTTSSTATCLPYSCKPGCSLGEVQSHLVPQNAVVRIIGVKPGSGCHRTCKCSAHSRLHQCHDVTCTSENQCFLTLGMIYDHNAQFNRGCNRCVCYAGEVVCTKRQCATPALVTNENRNSLSRALPCGCNSVYSPVCAHNGRTFPNACLARCHGLVADQIVNGSCSTLNPCHGHPCAAGSTCVPRRETCLTDNHQETSGCRHYICVHGNDEQCQHGRLPICDASGENRPNLCSLGRQALHRRIGYFGRCLSDCRQSGVVCGINGETYSSECAAWADGVLSDYDGSCRTTAPLTDAFITTTPCVNVSCPKHKTMGCSKPLLPPGACCPICAGEIRALVSGVLADQAASSFSSSTAAGGAHDPVSTSSSSSSSSGSASRDGGNGHRPLTVMDIVQATRLLIHIYECQSFGYMSIEGEMILIVAPISRAPTDLQVKACSAEAERLGALMMAAVPPVVVSPALSACLAVQVRTSTSTGSIGGSRRHSQGDSDDFDSTDSKSSAVSAHSVEGNLHHWSLFYRSVFLVIFIAAVVAVTSSSSGFRPTGCRTKPSSNRRRSPCLNSLDVRWAVGSVLATHREP